jgi:CRISPR-associated endonuclease/helicase Cas3
MKDRVGTDFKTSHPAQTAAQHAQRNDTPHSWPHLPLMGALTALAALLHDLSKATQTLQERLTAPRVRERNHYRQE